MIFILSFNYTFSVLNVAVQVGVFSITVLASPSLHRAIPIGHAERSEASAVQTGCRSTTTDREKEACADRRHKKQMLHSVQHDNLEARFSMTIWRLGSA
jgi:hypothetical protein